MKSPNKFSMQACLNLVVLLVSIISSSSSFLSSYGIKPNLIPRLSPIERTPPFLHDYQTLSLDSVSNDLLETYFYNQTLDHFNYRPESYKTFPQRFVVNSKYWGGKNAPIFAYFGAEAPLDGDIQVIGFLDNNALQFKALLVYIEVQIFLYHKLVIIKAYF